MAEWLKMAVSVLAAASASYMGIRVDLAAITVEQGALRRDVGRHETIIEQMRSASTRH